MWAVAGAFTAHKILKETEQKNKQFHQDRWSAVAGWHSSSNRVSADREEGQGMILGEMRNDTGHSKMENGTKTETSQAQQ